MGGALAVAGQHVQRQRGRGADEPAPAAARGHDAVRAQEDPGQPGDGPRYGVFKPDDDRQAQAKGDGAEERRAARQADAAREQKRAHQDRGQVEQGP